MRIDVRKTKSRKSERVRKEYTVKKRRRKDERVQRREGVALVK